MKQSLMMCLACVALAQSACATRPAPGISGHWKALNRYASQPQEIPLAPAYEFAASPLDLTLKTLVERWAHDAKMSMDYRHRSDFTLYEPVSKIRTSNLHEALAALSKLYAAQHVELLVEGNSIVVREAAGTGHPAGTATPTTTHDGIPVATRVEDRQ